MTASSSPESTAPDNSSVMPANAHSMRVSPTELSNILVTLPTYTEFTKEFTTLNDRRHDDNGTRIAHEIETRLHHGEKTHSVIHDELHKLQKLDSHGGVVDHDKFKHDVNKVENKLHKDGYLPNLHLKVDGHNRVHLENKKHHPKDDITLDMTRITKTKATEKTA